MLKRRKLFAAPLARLEPFGGTKAMPKDAVLVCAEVLQFYSQLVLTAQAFRSGRSARVRWRDYVTLTKPRIMSLLLLTGFCGLVVGARGLPAWWVVVVT